MRIDLNNSFLPNDSTQAIKSGPATEAVAKGATGDDTAELSSHYLSIAALTSAVGQIPEVRQEKVAALADTVRNGSYEVSPQHIAAAIMTEMGLDSAA